MPLDAPTLMVVMASVALIMGMLFLLASRQPSGGRTLAVWGTAYLLGAVGTALMGGRGVIPNWLSIGAANAILLLTYGLIWSGARSFEGRRTPPAALAAGPGLWLAACLVPAFYGSITARVILASVEAATYCILTIAELRRGRAVPLVSRGPTIILLASHAALYLMRVPASLVVPVPESYPLSSAWASVIGFTAVLYMVTHPFLFMALAKERLEWEHRLTALTDPLTGVANRRGLEERAAGLLAGEATVLLLDLDHFKRVNDTYGHAIGDAALVALCTVAGALLPPRAVFGRLGGEEFACVLPGEAPAGRLAETIRQAVADLRPDGVPGFRLTVSIGAASGAEGLDALLGRADRALYRAKRLGRDRVIWDRPVPAGPARLSAA
ncbi:GGDEF domain-containing protein [Methylobacterium sp. ID0610]|uniref:GGDEF domain-containing protein n=1 Tax=Methylobacterium carpenticola TaxID=3344827 RepID=UPI00367E6DD3